MKLKLETGLKGICCRLELAIYLEMLPGIRIIPSISTSRSSRRNNAL